MTINTRLPAVTPSPSRQNRRLIREIERTAARFVRYCDVHLCAAMLRERKLCARTSRPFKPAVAALNGTVVRSDEKIFSVVFDTNILLPDGTAFSSRAADSRCAATGFPLTLEVLSDNPKKLLRELRVEARRQLDIRARFDMSVKPRKLARCVTADRLAVTDSGLEFVLPNDSLQLGNLLQKSEA